MQLRSWRRRLSMAVVGLCLLSAWDGRGQADDAKASVQEFFDGMRDRDYEKAMHGFLAIMALDKNAPAEGQRACFDAVESADAADAATLCKAFAEKSGNDPRAHVGVALADIINERPLNAVKSVETALKLDPQNFPAHILRGVLMHGGAGAIGGGWAVPNSASKSTLADAVQRFEAGDYAAAAAAFKNLYDAGQVHGSVPLMLYVARKRAGLATGGELDAMHEVGGARYEMLISALRGEATPREALSTYMKRWADGGDYASNRFFLGEAAMIQGDAAEAKRLLTRAAAVKEDLIEVELAKAELSRLD